MSVSRSFAIILFQLPRSAGFMKAQDSNRRTVDSIEAVYSFGNQLDILTLD
jgi:hypothetical protein